MIEEKQKEEEDLIKIRMVEEIVPRRFYKYLKMFKKKESEIMLTRKTWDYVIDLKKKFVPKKRKIYLLLKVERKKVEKFIKDQLRKGYIWPSKSLQISLVFFILKKRMMQDYRYLNSWTIKNNYLLPLISDLIDNIGKRKIFTKIDFR